MAKVTDIQNMEIEELKKKLDWYINSAPPKKYNENEVRKIVGELRKRDFEERQFFGEGIKNTIVINPEPEELVSPHPGKTYKKAFVGMLAAAAAITALVVTINEGVSMAGRSVGIFNFLRNDREVLIATKKNETNYYKSFNEIPVEYKKQVWKFEHDKFELEDIEISYTDDQTTITSHYKDPTPDSLEYFYTELSTYHVNDITMQKKEDKEFDLIDTVNINEVSVNIYENIGYDETTYIMEFRSNMSLYRVIGNLPRYEIQGIIMQYIQFVFGD